MTFTSEEKRLLLLYHSGSLIETSAVLREALPDIIEPDVSAVAVTLIRKLDDINDTEFDSIDPESGVFQ